MKTFLFFFVLIIYSFSYSQEGNWWENKNSDNDTVSNSSKEKKKDTVVDEPGEVKIIKDKRIDKLIEFKSTTIPPASGPQIDGYRVQLFFDQNKSEVNEARARALEINPDFDTYVEYHAPNYNLLLGNYRTRLEAEKMRSQLIEEYPEAIIVNSRIYFPENEDSLETK